MPIIALEGIDGSGKTTIIKELKEKYKNNENVVFIKSPIPPFYEMTSVFWKSPPYVRLTFFSTSNYFFSKTTEEEKTYILDRYIYSTFATHISSLGKNKVVNHINDMTIKNPEISYLIKAPIEEIKKRLKKRNNPIDNNLDIDNLYSCYYGSLSNEFGKVEVLNNRDLYDLDKNISIISNTIDMFNKT